ncbi:hypothetical protein E2542_SST10034 [Spatholobus suberectus]|nr:hypothetical protein E2542_SST10034 [Spatholobus suberectus]
MVRSEFSNFLLWSRDDELHRGLSVGSGDTSIGKFQSLDFVSLMGLMLVMILARRVMVLANVMAESMKI